jgi:DedD protein
LSREPSYYEIALTQRQVVIAFVILLTCLVVAFFSGVWVGSGGRGAAPGDRGAETVAQLTPGMETPAPEGSPDGSKDTEPERLHFFDEQQTPPASRPEPTQPVRQAPPAQPPPTADRPGPSGNLPRDNPNYDPRTDPRRRSDLAPAVRPAPEPPEPVDPRATEAPGAGGPVIQVFSSHDQAQAQQVLDRLLRADLDAYLEAADVDGVIRYRVRLGPFADRAQAEAVASQLRQDFKLDTWITQ